MLGMSTTVHAKIFYLLMPIFMHLNMLSGEGKALWWRYVLNTKKGLLALILCLSMNLTLLSQNALHL